MTAALGSVAAFLLMLLALEIWDRRFWYRAAQDWKARAQEASDLTDEALEQVDSCLAQTAEAHRMVEQSQRNFDDLVAVHRQTVELVEKLTRRGAA